MGNLLVTAAIGPAVFAVLAVFNAISCRSATWRQRLAKLLRDLRACAVALALLLCLGGLLHALGIERATDVSCQPSPNGRLCEDE